MTERLLIKLNKQNMYLFISYIPIFPWLESDTESEKSKCSNRNGQLKTETKHMARKLTVCLKFSSKIVILPAYKLTYIDSIIFSHPLY